MTLCLDLRCNLSQFLTSTNGAGTINLVDSESNDLVGTLRLSILDHNFKSVSSTPAQQLPVNKSRFSGGDTSRSHDNTLNETSYISLSSENGDETSEQSTSCTLLDEAVKNAPNKQNDYSSLRVVDVIGADGTVSDRNSSSVVTSHQLVQACSSEEAIGTVSSCGRKLDGKETVTWMNAIAGTSGSTECFSCNSCGKQFKREASFRRHKCVYPPQVAPIDDSNSTSSSEEISSENIDTDTLDSDVSSSETSSRFACNLCHKVFRDKDKFYHHQLVCAIDHKQSKLQGKDSKCYICGKSFVRPRTMLKHIKLCKKSCKLQKQVSSQLQSGSKTGKSNGKTVVFECALCDKKLKSESKYQRHMDGHEKPSNPKAKKRLTVERCQKCLQTFTTRISRVRHSKFCPEDKINMCKCGKKFMHIKSFENHLIICEKTTVIDEPEEQSSNWNKADGFPCQVCGKKFSHINAMKEHLLKCGFSEIACEYCRKTFLHNGALGNHVRWCSKKNKMRISMKVSSKKNTLVKHRERDVRSQDTLSSSSSELAANERSSSQIGKLLTSFENAECDSAGIICATRVKVENNPACSAVSEISSPSGYFPRSTHINPQSQCSDVSDMEFTDRKAESETL